MDEAILKAEQRNLDETLLFLRTELEKETTVLADKRDDLKEMNKYMWIEYSFLKPGDEERAKEMAQLLTRFNQAAHQADNSSSIISKYQRLLASPYFGRFDIEESGIPGGDKIYVGFHNLFDLKSGRVYVYDWRSPIASVFYRYELGPCHYESPDGRIEGRVLLKRQLKAENSLIKYYADSGLVIRDDILLEALSRSATPKMRSIVETIQKEQDLIIRDLTSEILIVSGQAGSGKTSIALHRVAYLLYESKTTRATSKNVLILSPNGVFSDYVDHVLPDLGEEQVMQTTIDDLHEKIIKNIKVQSKHGYLEGVMSVKDPVKLRSGQRAFAFKNSRLFARILDNYALLYERRLHAFSDVILGGKLLYSARELKALFLDNKAKLPAEARLKRLFDRVAGETEPVFNEIQAKLREFADNNDNRRFEEEIVVNRFMKVIRKRFFKKLRRQLSLDPAKLYLNLLTDTNLFLRASKGLKIPSDAKVMLNRCAEAIKNGFLPFEDSTPLMYLTEKLCGAKVFADVRHVVVDEAQDYSPMDYLSFKRLFKTSRFTILGDNCQTVGKQASPAFFNRVKKYMDNPKKPKACFVSLTKSYRSSMEIHSFCGRILKSSGVYSESFSRSGEEPDIITGNRGDLLTGLSRAVNSFKTGSMAVLTKTAAEASTLYKLLDADSKTLTQKSEKLDSGLNVMPVYMSKGLEFDYVLVWGANSDNYKTTLDRHLLYVACTRALHKLTVFADGDLTPFLLN